MAAPDYKRPKYRQGRNEVAVKAYTLNQESRHLRVENVNIQADPEELVKQFALYGEIEEYSKLDGESPDAYSDTYRISFSEIQHSRFAKRKLNKSSFLGLTLAVSYACDLETIEDVRAKLQERRDVVNRKVSHYADIAAKKAQDQLKQPENSSRVWSEQPISADEWTQHGSTALFQAPVMLQASSPQQLTPEQRKMPTQAASSKGYIQTADQPFHPYYAQMATQQPVDQQYQANPYYYYYPQYYTQYYGHAGYPAASGEDGASAVSDPSKKRKPEAELSSEGRQKQRKME